MLLPRRHLLAAAAAAGLVGAGDPAPPGRGPEPRPTGLDGGFALAADWTFGRIRPEATVRDHAELARQFRFRYIYDGGRLDGLPTYWSRHRDYPAGDPRSLHVFTDTSLVLKGRIPPGGGVRPGGIESGMLRALLPVTPGMVVEMRARLPHGLGTWPAFWLNPGVELPGGGTSATPWPPEIDIFEFFEWQGRDRPRIMTAHVQTAGRPADFGDPHDVFSRFVRDNYEPGFDFSADFHTFALDWRADLPTWLLDGEPIKQTRYRWGDAPPAHILVTNQIGMTLAGVDLTGMRADEAAWDYTLDWLRVWRRV